MFINWHLIPLPTDLISVSSDSSESLQDHGETMLIEEDTEVDEVKIIEPPRKRPRRK